MSHDSTQRGPQNSQIQSQKGERWPQGPREGTGEVAFDADRTEVWEDGDVPETDGWWGWLCSRVSALKATERDTWKQFKWCIYVVHTFHNKRKSRWMVIIVSGKEPSVGAKISGQSVMRNRMFAKSQGISP